jgi:histidinol-phosphate aminotransferase
MSRFLAHKLEALEPYTPGEQPQGIPNLIKLNTNENPYPPAPAVRAVLNDAAASDLRLYSDPSCAAFLQAMADTYGVKPTQVFAGNGSDEVLAFCTQAFCQSGAAFPDLTYGFYPVFCRLYGVPYTEIPLREDFSLAVEDYADEPGTLFIANPNAPTGLALSRTQVEVLLRQNVNRLVVVDEAYVDFGGESAVPLLEQYDNLLVAGTFSKSRSLAGARLGYAIGSEALIADLNRVKFSFNPYNINRITLAAGVAALQEPDYFRTCCQAVMEVRQTTAEALRALGFTVTESKANFLFAGAHPALPAQVWFARLRQAGILVRYFGQPRIADYVRITVGTQAQMEALLSATRRILNENDMQ